MSLTQIAAPYPIFTDTDGTPLDDGYIYIGEINKNPETNPITVYWDPEFKFPAPQPIRTNNGYPWRMGTPAMLYADSQFSITIRNKRRDLVLYAPVGFGVNPAAVSGSVAKDDFVGDGVTTQFSLSSSPATELATNVFINGAYQEKDTYTLSGSLLTFSEAPPIGSSIEAISLQSSVIGATAANLVSYQPPGAGAINTDVQSKLRESVSVKDFGAVGDGLTDDTAAIQAALDSGKGGIYFPEGKYRVTAQIDVPSDVLLFGAGKRKSIIAADMPTVGIYLLKGQSVSNVTFRDLSLWGNLTENAGANKAFASAYMAGCTNVLFDNCEFSTCMTHTLTITKDFTASWIQGGNANSQASVDALIAVLSTTIRVTNCSFRYAGSNHFAAFGVNGLWLEDCDFSNDVTFYDVLVDGTSSSTSLADYAVNLNVNILNNIGSNSMLIVDTSTANIEGNTNEIVYVYSYDFNQQLANLATPFFHQNYVKRGIRVTNNNLSRVITKSYGYITIEDNQFESSDVSQTLVNIGGNAILWGGGTTYYDSLTTTTIDTEFVNTVVESNTITAAHTGTTGISGNDLYRVTRDNVFSTKGSGAFTTTDVVGSSAMAAQSMLYNIDNLKLKRKSRFINEVLDSGVTTITVLSGARSANASISFNYNGSVLGNTPLVFATIQNSNSVIPAAQEPAVASAYAVTGSAASLTVWLAANAAADLAITVAWVVVAQ